MWGIFLINALIIFTVGPGHIEGGFDAVKDKGVKPAIEQAIKDADASTLRGNYGND